MKEEEKSIIVDFDDINSIKEAEKIKSRCENEGYSLSKTIQIGFNKFKMKMKKVI